MNHAEDLLSALREFSDSDLPHFTDCVRSSFGDFDPAFTRPRYGEFFFHCASTVPGWLSRVVMANCDAESQGSEKLFWLWRGSASNEQISRDVMVHAKDEARHSRVFISLLEHSFPKAYSEDALNSKRESLFKVTPSITKSPRHSLPEEELIDHLVQMNMGEIRTRIHMVLLAPVIYALTPADSKPRVQQMLEGLVTDEIRHINYTAHFIESWCQNGASKRVKQLYSSRLVDFHRVTVEQTEVSVRAYGNGQYPDLLEI